MPLGAYGGRLGWLSAATVMTMDLEAGVRLFSAK
jgi:hypothetical protein